uniref:Fasciclin-1-like n=1 Tax=Crassostrea virginica TaxID=6565 RepID=A0A8B8C4K8_CRAVI|nr:fasciclin-1-like [Crassostrea virginica]
MECRTSVLQLLHLLYFLGYVQGQWSGYGTILYVLQNTPGFSKFAELVERAGLSELFDHDPPYLMTLFAFNDTAYNNLSENERNVFENYTKNQLADYIKFCTVFNKYVYAHSILDNRNVRSSDANGDRLFFNRIEKRRPKYELLPHFDNVKYLEYVNGVQISEDRYNRDIFAWNGLVNSMDGVMRKTSFKTAYGWINRPQNSAQSFTRFLNLMSRLDVWDDVLFLSSPDNFMTFFVPNNNAMEKIPAGELRKLEVDPVRLYKILRAHIIRNHTVFTNFISGNVRKNGANGLPIILRNPSGYNVSVSSEGVIASIVEGDIPVANGVVHVVDQLLGFVYNNVREQIQVESTDFDQLINLGSDTIRNFLAQCSNVTVFVPLKTALQRLKNVPGIAFNSNQALVDRVLRLHILQSNNSIEISSLSEFDQHWSAKYVQTLYNNSRLAIYYSNYGDETYVRGGNMKARIIRPDIKTVNGMVHVIDTVLGVPYLDLPMLICHDVWLLKAYDYMRRLGLKNYITDRRFTAETCSFEINGYPPIYPPSVITECPGYCDRDENADEFPCYLAVCVNSTQSTPCPSYCQEPVYANVPSCRECNGNSTSRCPDQFISFCSSQANVNQIPCNTYPCNMLNHTLDLGFCGSTTEACNFTVFVPNSSAIDNFMVSVDGQTIMRDTPRFQWLFKRLILPGRLYMDDIQSGDELHMTMLNGELVTLRKDGDGLRGVRLMFGEAVATVIHRDEGATNGVVHVIDKLLFVNDDLTRNITGLEEPFNG